MALVEVEALDVGGGEGDDMGVTDGLAAKGLGSALRKGEGEGRPGLLLEMGLGVKDWGLVLTAGWLSVVLRALTMTAGHDISRLLLMDSTTGIGLSAVLGEGVEWTGLGLGVEAGVLVLRASEVLPALAM